MTQALPPKNRPILLKGGILPLGTIALEEPAINLF